jgi:multicomponent Na+:H+ antiporter subunit G
MTVQEIIALGLMFIGLVFLAVAAIGFARFPDVFSRLHVTGVIDTLGAPLILLGAAVHTGFNLTSGKLILAIIFLYGTSPLVGHLLGQSAARMGTPDDPDSETDRRDPL